MSYLQRTGGCLFYLFMAKVVVLPDMAFLLLLDMSCLLSTHVLFVSVFF